MTPPVHGTGHIESPRNIVSSIYYTLSVVTILTDVVYVVVVFQFPFEVNKSNLYKVERLFNPGFGLMVQEKICDWLLACFPN